MLPEPSGSRQDVLALRRKIKRDRRPSLKDENLSRVTTFLHRRLTPPASAGILQYPGTLTPALRRSLPMPLRPCSLQAPPASRHFGAQLQDVFTASFRCTSQHPVTLCSIPWQLLLPFFAFVSRICAHYKCFSPPCQPETGEIPPESFPQVVKEVLICCICRGILPRSTAQALQKCLTIFSISANYLI